MTISQNRSVSQPLYLNAVVFGLGSHEAAWRMPESNPLAPATLGYWTDLARTAESAGFEALFLGDILALQEDAEHCQADAPDPIVVLSAMAAVTRRIGLIGTASTSFDHPYHLARRFASLDHLSGGRAGWNIVTSSYRQEARNFGLTDMPEHDARYARAEDVVQAVLALWQSWDADARAPDKMAGRYLAPESVRPVNHQGPYVATAGPLNVPRPPQGRPVLAQAGSSEAGRAFAARHADIIFTVQATLSEAREFRNDIRVRVAAANRDPDSVLVFPGIVPIAGTTVEAARARLDALGGLTVIDHARTKLSKFLGMDLSRADLDAPLRFTANLSPNQFSQSRTETLIEISRRDGLTLRQLIIRTAAGRGHLLCVGTGPEIAATMADWHAAGAADGFNVMCPVTPADLRGFAQLVCPELERLGLRDLPTSSLTLRERYGLSS